MLTEAQLSTILKTSRTIAVCGMSRNPAKTAHRVPLQLRSLGFEIIPVNPFAEEIAGMTCYPNLLACPETIDIVEVFRPSADALAVVEAALERHKQRGDVRLIWLQLGIFNVTAQVLAEAAKMPFVQNRCMAVDVPGLL